MKKISTELAPKAIGPYSQGIIIDNMVYTSGQIALVPATGELVNDDIKEQTRQVLDNLKSVLEAGGSCLDCVIKTTCYLKNMDDFAVFNDIYAEYFEHKPARSCVGVSALPKGALVEIEAVAKLCK